jgi:drug/metabolite transporter (DMT)-like permease
MHLTQSAMDAHIGAMSTVSATESESRREAAGFLVSVVFVCLASVRDVYLGGLFQRVSPPLIAIVAFLLGSAVFLPIGAIAARRSFAVLWRQRRVLLWVNISTAGAWIAFLFALKLIEPTVVQILYSGIGPLSVIWIEGGLLAIGPKIHLTAGERLSFLAVGAALLLSVTVVVAGLSGVGQVPVGRAALGVFLAAFGGVSISVSTMLCRRLNDAGVAPSALLAVRFPLTVVGAAVVVALSPSGLPRDLSWINVLVAVAAVLIVVPNYVAQFAISLASPLTVRVVLAVAPVMIFFLHIAERRLAASPYSLMVAILYGFAAIWAAVARRRAMRAIAVRSAGTS